MNKIITKYRVRLLEGHDAQPDQIVDGCLGNVFGSGKVELYSRGEALKKARLFLNGKIEKVEIPAPMASRQPQVPFRVIDCSEEEYYLVKQGEKLIATVDYSSDASQTKEEAHTTAQRIACMDDMLTALQAIMNATHDASYMDDAMEFADNVVKKTTL